MKGVQFSVIDEIGVDQKVNGMAISLASLIGFNLPDVALHPICGALLDAFDAVTAYKLIFYILLGMLVLGFVTAVILLRLVNKDKKAAAQKTDSLKPYFTLFHPKRRGRPEGLPLCV